MLLKQLPEQGLYWVVCHCLSNGSLGSNLFVHGARDSSPSIRERHHGIFNVNQLPLTDGTPSLTSIRGTVHTLMNHPDCEIPDDIL